MGCYDLPIGGYELDPIAKILATLDIKVEEYQKVFEKEAQKAKDKFEKQQEKRKSILDNWKKESKEITEQDIRELNKAEFKVEVEFLVNLLDKMHYIFSIALELVEPLKKFTIDKLMELAIIVHPRVEYRINSQIEEIKKYSIFEFLGSSYGKDLREAAENKGMRATILRAYKYKLFKERKVRRKVERELYNIEKNEFDDEEMDDLKLDLYGLITEEEKGLNNNFKEYARSKIIDAWLGSQ